MPRRVKKRRQLTTDTGADAGWEEYWDYIFPEDEVRSSSSFSNHSFFQVAKPNMNLLKMAKEWKKKNDSDSDSDSDSD